VADLKFDRGRTIDHIEVAVHGENIDIDIGFENVAILLTYKIDFMQSLHRACTLYLHDNVANYQNVF
jgi:hypothetical protein